MSNALFGLGLAPCQQPRWKQANTDPSDQPHSLPTSLRELELTHSFIHLFALKQHLIMYPRLVSNLCRLLLVQTPILPGEPFPLCHSSSYRGSFSDLGRSELWGLGLSEEA